MASDCGGRYAPGRRTSFVGKGRHSFPKDIAFTFSLAYVAPADICDFTRASRLAHLREGV